MVWRRRKTWVLVARPLCQGAASRSWCWRRLGEGEACRVAPGCSWKPHPAPGPEMGALPLSPGKQFVLLFIPDTVCFFLYYCFLLPPWQKQPWGTEWWWDRKLSLKGFSLTVGTSLGWFSAVWLKMQTPAVNLKADLLWLSFGGDLSVWFWDMYFFLPISLCLKFFFYR